MDTKCKYCQGNKNIMAEPTISGRQQNVKLVIDGTKGTVYAHKKNTVYIFNFPFKFCPMCGRSLTGGDSNEN
ncbi:hypothetical protein PT287_08320 [Lactobacillus sp. ESL0679]|uniref:hypothetical protein n=1 Tax=Lactobacillus sp. ESL0679 TaxID=2983209 RepID=UPI0023F6353D|nr:hypothetical protein [Lactobacillus sp. ESL0679]MDF7683502.1 hypothetical protein [Lactobacillus sp. ESL0679]